jgi:diguanylate cyclase (GGDEF)-like protein
VVNDITERKEMQEQVRQLAFYDPLTKLPNRRLFNDRLSQAIAASKRSACYGALLFLDLDNFKALNDTHGHAAGDLLLIEAAIRLKGCVRATDTVARLGGDEFVVVVGSLNVDKAESTAQARLIAGKIEASLSTPYLISVKHDGKVDSTIEHQCTASIGAVVFIDHEGSQEDFLRWADTAMYKAKEAGRSLIRFYEMDAMAPALPLDI